MSSSVNILYGCARIPPIASSKFPREKILLSRTFSSCVPCISLPLFTPTLIFTGVAGVTCIDAGETGVASVVIGGAGVAGVAGGTGVPFVGVALCAGVFFFVVCSRWRCLRLVRTSCALAWLQFFFLLTGSHVHASHERHPPRSAGLLPFEPLMVLRVSQRSDFCRRPIPPPTTHR